MTIDIKTIASRMTDEEVRAICATLLSNTCGGLWQGYKSLKPIYTRLTTPEPQPDDSVTGEDVRVGGDEYHDHDIRCGSFAWHPLYGWQRGVPGNWYKHKDDAVALRDRLVARGELPTVNGRVATRKECGL